MAVAYDAVGAGNRATGSSTTLATSWSHTIVTSAADTVVLAAVSYSISNTGTQNITSTATYGGTTMTPVAWKGIQGASGGNFVKVFALFNPPTGAQTVQITTGGSDTKVSVMGNSVSYTSVSGFGVPVLANNAASTNPTATVTSATGHMVFAAIVDGLTMTAGKTSRYSAGASVTGIGDFMLIEDASGASSVSMNATASSSGWSEVAIDLLPGVSTTIAFDSVATGAYTQTSGITTQSWSHTCSGSDRVVFAAINVGIDAAHQTPYSSYTRTVTYDGVAMTSLGAVDSGSPTYHAGWVELFYLMNPPTGAKTVAVTLGSGTNVLALGGSSVSYTGVGSVYGSTIASNSSTISLGVAQSVAGYSIAAFVTGNPTLMGAYPRQRYLKNTDSTTAADNLVIADYPAATTLTAMQDNVSDAFGIVSASMLPVGGGAPGVQYIHSMTSESNSLSTMPSHQAGDIIVMFAFRDGSTTAPTMPSGWSSLESAGANTCSGVLAFKVAASANETSGTWTSATLLVCHVYRGAVVAAHSLTGASSATVNYPALTLQNTDGTSWVAGFAGHRSINGSLATPPTGMTNRRALEGATADGAGHDTNGGVSSWTSQNVSSGETASGYGVALLELRPARTYYISAAGSNSNNGLTTSTPWLDFTNLAMVHGPGDIISFRGGDTFSINSYFSMSSTGGVASMPVTYTSYGTGKATWTVSSTTKDGIYFDSNGGIVFNNLIITGPGLTSTRAGLIFEKTSAGRSDYLQFLNCEISGFQNGLSIGGDDYTMGYSNVTISGCKIHDNWQYGIITWGGDSGGTYSNSNLTIQNTQIYNTTGKASYTTDVSGVGTGIGSCQGVTIQGCAVYNNGPNNGQSGNSSIGCSVGGCKDVTVRNCVAYNNQDTLNGGGFGFNIDGVEGTSFLEYCLSYGNGGQGIVVANAVGGSTVTVRYCIGWGNSTIPGGGSAEMDLWTPGGTIYVYNNTFVSRYDSVVQVRNGGSGAQFYNNIFYAASGKKLILTDTTYTSGNLLFAGNLYYAAGTFSISWNGTNYSSISAWRTGVSGEEVFNSGNTGITADPQLAAAGTAPTVTDPTNIGSGADGLKWTSNSSPAFRAGLSYFDLGVETLGASVSNTSDYWGNGVELGKPSIGAYRGPLDKMASLTDTFPGSSLDSSKWSSYAIGSGAAMAINNEVEITTGTASDNNGGIVSNYYYDLTSSYALIQVVDAGTQQANYALYPLYVHGGTYDHELVYTIINNQLRVIISTSAATHLYPSDITFSAATHKWLRIRESGGTVYWEYSTDGFAWTTQYSTANPFSVISMTIQIVTYNYGVIGSSTVAKLDNFNVPPVSGFFATFK